MDIAIHGFVRKPAVWGGWTPMGSSVCDGIQTRDTQPTIRTELESDKARTVTITNHLTSPSTRLIMGRLCFMSCYPISNQVGE